MPRANCQNVHCLLADPWVSESTKEVAWAIETHSELLSIIDFLTICNWHEKVTLLAFYTLLCKGLISSPDWKRPEGHERALERPCGHGKSIELQCRRPDSWFYFHFSLTMRYETMGNILTSLSLNFFIFQCGLHFLPYMVITISICILE